MPRAAIIWILVLLAAPNTLAWGSETVEADLRLDRGALLQGDMSWTASEGVLDLAPALAAGEPVTIAWQRADGYRIDNSRIYAGTEIALGDNPPRNTSMRFGAGVLRLTSCHEPCRAALLADGAGHLVFRGSASSELSWTRSDREYWALGRHASPSTTFHHVVAPKAFLLAQTPATDPDAMGLGKAVASASGSLRLFLHNVTAEFEEGPRSTPVDVSPRSEPIVAPLGTGSAFRLHQGFVLLKLSNASFESVPETATLLLSHRPVLELSGAVEAPSATGSLRIDGKPMTLEGDRLRVGGLFALEPHVAVESTIAAPLARDALRMRVSGEASEVSLAGAALVDASGEESVAQASFLAVALALLLVGVRFILPLYSRIGPAQVLSNPTRRRILELVRARPGSTAVALSRDAGVARTVALHHLAMLEAHSLVAVRRVGWARQIFPAQATPSAEDLAATSALVDPTRRRIAEAILAGAVTQAELVERVGISQRLVSYHVGHLVEAGLLLTMNGRPRRYAATEALRATIGHAPERATTAVKT